MAGGPCQHRRLDVELEQVLVFTWRWQDQISALGGELLCQPLPDLEIRDVAGHPTHIEGVLVVVEVKRVHPIAPVTVEVPLLGRGDDEGVQPGLGEQRAHWMQPWPAVGPHRAEESKADAVVVQQAGSLAGKVGLLGFEVPPRDHVERAWQISKSSVNSLSRGRLERCSHLCKEIRLLVAAGDLQALELAVEPGVDVEVTGILVEVKERLGAPREITALALPQLGEPAQLHQQCLQAVKVILRRVPHGSSMTWDVKATQRALGRAARPEKRKIEDHRSWRQVKACP
jgi:hypothetical protein